MMGLTARQAECLQAIRDLTIRGVSPSVDELRERLGLSSKCGVHRMLVALEERGCIRRVKYRNRAIEVISSVAPGKTPSDVASAVCEAAWKRAAAGEKITRPVLFEIVREAAA